MENLRIGIVEDDLLIAESIAITLQKIGYRPIAPVRNYATALQMIETEKPDLLLLDIMLDGEKDGIELARKINQDYGLPFIFLTGNSDHATVNRAKEVKPYSYLIKPFNEQDLFTSIEIAFGNYNEKQKTKPGTSNSLLPLSSSIFVKEGDVFYKVAMADILYVESDNVYLNLFTTKRTYLIRAKLDDFIHDLSPHSFFRTHRSYAINVSHLETVNSLTVSVAGKEVPLNKTHRDELLHLIKSVK